MSAARLRWAEVDLQAIRHNVAQLLGRLSEGCALLAVVKADGYGHGAVQVGQAALDSGAQWLAVSTLEEVASLRLGGIISPVLMMGPVAEGAEGEAIRLEARVAVNDAAGLARLAAAAAATGGNARVHLKVDTGMGRLGCSPEEALVLARRLEATPGVALEGLWTHFAEADDPGSPRTAQQLHVFMGVVGALGAAGIRPSVLHAANSAAAVLYPSSQLTLVRCGLPLYGYPSADHEGLDLRPALAWKSRVVAVHNLYPGDRVGYGGTYTASSPRRTATVATGYADGYRRASSNRGQVLLGGLRVPILGRVSMDFITVDASDVPEVNVGDEVVLIGRQGGESVSASDLAASLDTIAWEVLTMIGPRVQRVFLNA